MTRSVAPKRLDSSQSLANLPRPENQAVVSVAPSPRAPGPPARHSAAALEGGISRMPRPPNPRSRASSE